MLMGCAPTCRFEGGAHEGEIEAEHGASEVNSKSYVGGLFNLGLNGHYLT